MQPTIVIGDRFLADKIRSLKEIKRGDVVVFRSPLNKVKLIKRVIGMPGEKIRTTKGTVFVDNHEFKEPYIVNPSPIYQGIDFVSVTVPEDSFFVLGDNRNNSQDSRHFGSIPFQNIIGRVNVILWSFDPEKGGIRWERINKKVE